MSKKTKQKSHAGAPPKLSYRTFWERLAAYGLDAFIVILPLSLLGNAWRSTSGPGLLYVIFSLLTSWVWIIYRVLMHGLRSQTLGKQVLHLRVVDESESPVSLQRAVLREIVPITTAVILDVLIILNYNTYIMLFDPNAYAGVSYPIWLRVGNYIPLAWIVVNVLTMLANDRRRAAHDYIARTLVFREIGATTQQFKKGTIRTVNRPVVEAQGWLFPVSGAILCIGGASLWIGFASSAFSTGVYQEISAPIQILLAGTWGAIAGWILHRIILGFQNKRGSLTSNPVIAVVWLIFLTMGCMLMCGLLVVAWMGSGG